MAGVKLEFAQFGDFDSFEVIRSLTSMAGLADHELPAPIATGLKTMFYVDMDIVADTVYFYRVRVLRGLQAYISSEVKCRAGISDEYWNYVDLLLLPVAASYPSVNIVDSSSRNRLVSRRSDVQIIDASTIGLDGGLFYFDGDSDRIDIGIQALGTGDYTIESYVYPINNNGGNARIFQVGAVGENGAFALIRSGTALSVERNNGGGSWGTHIWASNVLPVNTMLHIAVQRISGILHAYVNGAPVGSSNWTGFFHPASLYIGQSQQQSGGTDAITCYMKGFRLTTGQARYDAGGFTPDEEFLIE